jgi:chromosome segregation ATPase
MPQQSELISDIKQVLDISSRLDERAKIIQSNQEEMNQRLNRMIGDMHQLSSRVSVLESKNGGKIHELEDQINDLHIKVETMNVVGTSYMQKKEAAEKNDFKEMDEQMNKLVMRLSALETVNDSWHSKIKHYGGLVIQGIWVIIVCYILFKLGINTPPIP